MTLYRSFTPDLEVRSDGDGRTIVGIAVPYNRTIDVPSEGIRERFAPGAFAHQLRAFNRVAFSREHIPLGGSLIGSTKLLREDTKGLYGEWRVSRTAMGDETLELVRDGALRELSIGFKERRNRTVRDAAGTITERTRADLGEVAVVMAGAYGDHAVATGVRSAGGVGGHAGGASSFEPGVVWESEEDQVQEALRSLDVTREILANWRPLPLP